MKGTADDLVDGPDKYRENKQAEKEAAEASRR